MPRNMRRAEVDKRARARRDFALSRIEFNEPSVPRVSAAGPTSAPLKADDPEDRRLIEEALAKRRGTT